MISNDGDVGSNHLTPHSGKSAKKHKYEMPISRMTVDKLGVKLYDRVSAAISEIIANAYDADATEAVVLAPMGELLATRQRGVIRDKGYEIRIADNGFGMDVDEVNKLFLPVGREKENKRRVTPRGRKTMGRKGIGKLAPFGICKQIEIITAGGYEEIVEKK